MAALRMQGFEILGEREPWGQGKYEMGGIMVLAPNYSRMITLAPPQLKLKGHRSPKTPFIRSC